MTFNYQRYGSYVGSTQGVNRKTGRFNIDAAYLIGSGLYSFDTFTFTTAGIIGRTGPTLSNLLSSYDTTTNPWLLNPSFFNVVTQGFQEWTVPSTGNYQITAEGASGRGNASPQPEGALIQGEFTLEEGEIIKIVVGQPGDDDSISDASGGGGSYVVASPYNTNESILVIAGGGGGRNDDTGYTYNVTSGQGQSGTSGGTAPSGGGTGGGGINGLGGDHGNQTTMGGAGFFGNAVFSVSGSNKIMSLSFVNGAVGGRADYVSGVYGRGGFGGGGASGRNANFGPAGGGGGYSGGSAGYNSRNGGGGGSYNNGLNQINTAGGANSNSRSGAGQVTITKI